MVVRVKVAMFIAGVVVTLGVALRAHALRDPTIPLNQQPQEVAAIVLELNAIVQIAGRRWRFT